MNFMNFNFAANRSELTNEASLDPIRYWNHLFGDSETWWSLFAEEPEGYLSILRGLRPEAEKGRVNKKRLKHIKEVYFRWPHEKEEAAEYVLEESERGHNVYSCAHLLTEKKRARENAAPILTLWADGDEAEIPTIGLAPTLTVESSPGRHQFFWRLQSSSPPKKAEELNRRIAYAIGADKSGWDLTQLLRPPGTRNWDYAEVYDEIPIVRVV
jgi:RepB DNA-primase from phage plasmid